MFPFLIGGLVLVGGGAIAWTRKPFCNQCESKFTKNHSCVVCGKLVCGGCGMDYEPFPYKGVTLQVATRCCKAHISQMEERLAESKRQIDEDLDREAALAKLRERAAAQAGQVVLYSKNYGGHMEPLRLGKNIRTEYFKDKDAARAELQILAAMEDCFVVQQVTEHYRTDTDDGSYKYRVWSFSGVV